MTFRIGYNNPDAGGSFGLAYHYELLADRRRLGALRRGIELAVNRKRVLESGAGSGVLSIIAARAGARLVYAVEKDPVMVALLRENVRRSGCAASIRVIDADSRQLSLADVDGEAVDVLIAEHLSTWQVTEPEVALMNHLNRFLAHEATIRVPQCAWNRVELARSRYRFEDAVELRTHYFGFSGIPRPAALSGAATFRQVDFDVVNPTLVDDCVELIATRNGIVNSLRLTSPLRVFGSVSFRSSDSLMPPVVVPLARDLEVRQGDVVTVRCRYRYGTSWDQFQSTAEPTDRGRALGRPALPSQNHAGAPLLEAAGAAGG